MHHGCGDEGESVLTKLEYIAVLNDLSLDGNILEGGDHIKYLLVAYHLALGMT